MLHTREHAQSPAGGAVLPGEHVCQTRNTRKEPSPAETHGNRATSGRAPRRPQRCRSLEQRAGATRRPSGVQLGTVFGQTGREPLHSGLRVRAPRYRGNTYLRRLRLRPLTLLHGEEELELWRQLLLAVEAIREVDAAQPAIGVDLHAQRLDVVRPVRAPREVGEVEL